MRCAVIWFSVSVPVLSVQITVVAPSVSTDDRRRTSALRFAIRCVASASESVTVGSSPSGTSATVTPIANTKRSVRPIPASVATTKNSPPIATASSATIRVRWSSSRSSGLRSRRVCWASSAIRPNRVAIPVAVTSASAVPAVTYVPAKTCSSGATRADSPVSADSSARRSLAMRRSASAATRSPGASSNTSPGTTSSLAISTASPSRRART